MKIPGKERLPGIFVGQKGTRISKTATLKAPILLGDYCRVGENVSLTGPLVIGDHSVIEKGAALKGVIKWRAAQTGAGATVAEGGIIGRGEPMYAMKCNIHDRVVVGDRCVIGSLSSVLMKRCTSSRSR